MKQRRGLCFTLLWGGLSLLPIATAAADCRKVMGRQPVVVSLTAPAHPKATALTVRLSYSSGLALPGEGAAASVRERVRALTANTTVAVNDTQEGLRVVLARADGLEPGDLLVVEMDRCDEKNRESAHVSCAVEATGSPAGSLNDLACGATLKAK